MHGTMPRAVGGQAKDGRLREQAASMLLRQERDALHGVAPDAFDPMSEEELKLWYEGSPDDPLNR